MFIFLQILLINLIVSFDNIGVIAMASRGLDRKQANLARKLGIWLSLILKFAFVILVGFLFELQWLHIRLIGGIMLIYVIYGMLGEGAGKSMPAGKRFSRVILSIVAADISMSLDNVIAVLSIASGDSDNITMRGLLLVFLGLAVSAPILLWCSEAFMRWFERIKQLRYLCAGYLAYIAARMIFEDNLIEGFLEFVGFPYPTLLAALLGMFTVCLCRHIEKRA